MRSFYWIQAGLLLAFIFSIKAVTAQCNYGSVNSVSVCENGNSGTLYLTGNNTTIIRWESSQTGNAPWTTISNTNSTLAFKNVKTSTWFRAVSSKTGCATDTSQAGKITVFPVPEGGTITGGKNVCATGNSGTLTLTNYTGTISKWQLSTDGGGIWVDISGTTGKSSYSFNNLSKTTLYRAVVSSGPCGDDFSDIAKVTVIPSTNPGTLSGSATVCSGNNSGNLTLSGYTGSILRWETAGEGGSPWSTINDTSSSLSYSDLTKTSFYRAIIQSSPCSTDTSGTIKITVDPETAPGTILGSTEVCYGANQGEIVISGYTGSIQKWEYTTDNGNSWNTISNTTSKQSYSNLTVSTFYRAVLKSGVCTQKYTSDVKITVNPLPSVGFTLSNVCEGKKATFKNTSSVSSGTIAGYSWNFGDNTGSVTTSPTHYFENSGSYTVNLAVTTNKGCTDSAKNTLTVYPKPSVRFSVSNICEQNEAIFTNKSSISSGSLSHNWDFGNTTGSSSRDPKLTYSGSGTYRIVLIETSDKGCVDSFKKDLIVHPRARVKFVAKDACHGEEVDFTNNSTISSGSVSYLWRFGDGKISTLSEPSHKYSLTGSYQPKLIAVTDNNCRDSAWKTLNIYQNPVVRFTASDICEGAPVSFSNTSFIGTGNLNYFWDFGDDKGTSNQEDPDYKYSRPGSYNATLKIISDKNCSDSLSKVVEIFPRAIPDFSFNDVCREKEINFTNKTTFNTGSFTYLWNFGDGLSSGQSNPSHLYQTDGTYPVMLVSISSRNCKDTIIKNATVYPKPVAGFTVADKCLPDTVSFNNTSTVSSGTFTSLWDFGDHSGSSNLTAPVYKYSSPGTYITKLLITTPNNCRDSSFNEITIYPKPKASFSVKNVCFGETSVFQNTSVISSGNLSYLWNFGDKIFSSDPSPSHLFATTDTFLVSLIVTSSFNCRDTIFKPVITYPQPVADFNSSDECYGDTLNFYDSTRFTGDTLFYHWSFGDSKTSGETDPAHLFQSPGTYKVDLNVTTDKGCSDGLSRVVKVFPLPVTRFTAENICIDDSLELINLSSVSAGEIDFLWNFGDNIGSMLRNPVHSYTVPGKYKVTLLGTTGKGCMDSSSVEINIYPLPTPGFVAPAVCDGKETVFTDTSKISSGKIISYEWDFGDGTNSIQQNPEKQFLNPGSYNVSLLVSSDKNCKAIETKSVSLHPTPIANFRAEDVCFGESMQFENLSGGAQGLTYTWFFGDEDSSVLPSPSHKFNVAGVYPVLLRVRSAQNCRDSLKRYVEIFELPKIKAGNDTIISKGYPLKLNGSGGENFYWSPEEYFSDPSIKDPVINPLESREYFLFAGDKNGCSNSDTVFVEVIEDFKVQATNILTPDGNGENDSWKIINIDSYPTSTVHIFDRWGRTVFSKVGYDNSWNGKNTQGDWLADGTYYYVISFEGNEKVYKGAITLIRNN